jgi:predicted signal transduction protein with EAL and GGDEF domain
LCPLNSLSDIVNFFSTSGNNISPTLIAFALEASLISSKIILLLLSSPRGNLNFSGDFFVLSQATIKSRSLFCGTPKYLEFKTFEST